MTEKELVDIANIRIIRKWRKIILIGIRCLVGAGFGWLGTECYQRVVREGFKR